MKQIQWAELWAVFTYEILPRYLEEIPLGAGFYSTVDDQGIHVVVDQRYFFEDLDHDKLVIENMGPLVVCQYLNQKAILIADAVAAHMTGGTHAQPT